MGNISIREYLKNPKAASCNNFYDWFCQDRYLPAKQDKIDDILRAICHSPKINQDTMYVFYKNNCPIDGSLYDSFSICDLKTGDVLYWLTPACGHRGKTKGKAQVCDIKADDGEVTFEGSLVQVIAWFNKP